MTDYCVNAFLTSYFGYGVCVVYFILSGAVSPLGSLNGEVYELDQYFRRLGLTGSPLRRTLIFVKMFCHLFVLIKKAQVIYQ